jgi:hypothetical protein
MTELTPFAERLINKDLLPMHFVNRIEREIAKQKEQIKAGTRKIIQVDFNRMYNHKAGNIFESQQMRDSILDNTKLNPVLAFKVEIGRTDDFYKTAMQEYKYQRQQVLKGKRKYINVDYNDLYC